MTMRHSLLALAAVVVDEDPYKPDQGARYAGARRGVSDYCLTTYDNSARAELV